MSSVGMMPITGTACALCTRRNVENPSQRIVENPESRTRGGDSHVHMSFLALTVLLTTPSPPHPHNHRPPRGTTTPSLFASCGVGIPDRVRPFDSGKHLSLLSKEFLCAMEVHLRARPNEEPDEHEAGASSSCDAVTHDMTEASLQCIAGARREKTY